MNEIYPRLWIGSIASLRIYEEKRVEDNRDLRWTIVSLIESDKIQKIADAFLVRQKQVGNCRHVIWRLQDKSSSTLICERLESILLIIDEAVGTCCSQTNKNSTEEPIDNDSCLASSNSSACLVHCAQGISRSAAVGAAWLISRKGMTLEQSLEKIRKARPHAQPNLGFLAGLRALEQSGGDVERAIRRMNKKILEAE
jgi:Dual specificity phosphatase, catalytic domain